MKFQCYCCGDEVGEVIALVTMSESSVDRVFVMKPEHTDRVDDITIVLVREDNEDRQ